MSTVQIWETESTSLENTLRLAENIGSKLVGGEVIELVSDLGGGKTAFVKGLVRGLGSSDTVSSPSFTISNLYHSKNIAIHHFDFYRLKEAGLLQDELAELFGDPSKVVVIEWAEIVSEALPDERLTINIVPKGDTKRKLTIKYPKSLEYLIEKND